tara:strand:- start:34377 stop:34886 length:510 start_codon:yes stop_codon:yes gene_type:complete
VGEGLNKDGGINFERKRNFSEPEKTDKKPYGLAEPKDEEPEEPEEELSDEEISKNERLNAKLSKAKGLQAGGFAINTTTIIGAMFYLDSLLLDPTTVDTLNIINDMFATDINFEQIIATIQGYKAQIIGLAVSSQTMLMGYKDTVQKMKDRGNESFVDVLNEELEKTGI